MVDRHGAVNLLGNPLIQDDNPIGKDHGFHGIMGNIHYCGGKSPMEQVQLAAQSGS
jgi:hypothetical protein